MSLQQHPLRETYTDDEWRALRRDVEHGRISWPIGVEIVSDPLEVQIGGNHYKGLKIQPIEYILANGLGYIEGNVVKYVTRWKDKGGVDDLRKAKHYLELLIASIETPNMTAPRPAMFVRETKDYE